MDKPEVHMIERMEDIHKIVDDFVGETSEVYKHTTTLKLDDIVLNETKYDTYTFYLKTIEVKNSFGSVGIRLLTHMEKGGIVAIYAIKHANASVEMIQKVADSIQDEEKRNEIIDLGNMEIFIQALDNSGIGYGEKLSCNDCDKKDSCKDNCNAKQ